MNSTNSYSKVTLWFTFGAFVLMAAVSAYQDAVIRPLLTAVEILLAGNCPLR